MPARVGAPRRLALGALVAAVVAALLMLPAVGAATVGAATAGAVPSSAGGPSSSSVTGTLIGPGFYPRAVRLAHAGALDGTILASYQLGQEGKVLRSTDGGATFQPLSSIDVGAETTLAPPGGLCCIALWEMPVALGAYPAGTLLWAGSIVVTEGAVRHNRLAIWRSTDHGATWQRHGDCAESDGGLWEPDFHVANDGSLVCVYSDDGQEDVAPGAPIPQTLAETVSHDGGLTFGAPSDIVVDPVAAIGRPGMATTVHLPDGTWRMTNERCGALPPCQVRIRSGPDGIHWGDPHDPGTVVATATGSTLWHTPVLSWSPVGGPQGTLLLTGQIFNRANGFAEPTSGEVILANRRGGAGLWTPIDAPVHIPNPFDHYCPNYSSPVIALDGPRILELAAQWTGTECLVRYGTGTIPASIPDPTTTTTTTTSTTVVSSTTTPEGPGASPVASAVAAAPAYTG